MPRLATVDALKLYLDKRTAGDDPFLSSLLEAAENFAERYTGRRFSPDPALSSGGADDAPPVTRTLVPLTGASLIRVPDVRAITGVSYGGTALAAEDYQLEGPPGEPATHMALDWSLLTYVGELPGQLVITGRFGFNPTPALIKDGVLAHAARMYKERDAAYADVVTTDMEGGSLQYLRTLPARVKAAYDSYKVHRVAFV